MKAPYFVGIFSGQSNKNAAVFQLETIETLPVQRTREWENILQNRVLLLVEHFCIVQ